MIDKNTNIADDVLQAIKEEGLTPRPLWQFTIKNILFWVSAILFLLCGAVSVSLVIFVLDHGLWAEDAPRGGGRLRHAMQIFPFVWFGAFLLFLFVAEYLLSYTQKAYRYSLTVVTGSLIVASIVCGFALYVFGISHIVDAAMGRHIPRYEMLEHRIERAVHAPEQGRYAGRITHMEDEKYIEIQNPREGGTWTIDLTSADRLPRMLRTGMHVVVRGQEDGSVIKAYYVRPLLKKGREDVPRHEREERLEEDMRQ